MTDCTTRKTCELNLRPSGQKTDKARASSSKLHQSWTYLFHAVACATV